MRKKAFHTTLSLLVPVLLLLTVLTGCSGSRPAAQTGSSDASVSIPGTWQTASMGYEYNGSFQPEYYVRFTAGEIVYGHMNNEEFVPDHSDSITRLEESTAGHFKVQAESSNGVQYTYLTAESDPDVLEYYGTWKEEDFPETYSGGASLGRCS